MMKAYPKYKYSGVEWIGEIPVDWRVAHYRRITTRIVVGIAEAATHAYRESGVPIIRTTNLKKGEIQTEKLLYLDPQFVKSLESKAVYKNDLLTVRTGNAGITAVVPKILDKSQCFTMLISTLIDGYSPKYYYYFINSNMGQTYFDITAWGTAQKNISVPILGFCHIPIPSFIEQKQIANFLDHKTHLIDTLIEKKKRLIDLLKEERTAVINEAVTKGLDPDVPMKDSGIECLGEIPEHWDVVRLKNLVVDKIMYGANESAELEDRSLPRYIRITDFGNNGLLKKDTFKSLPFEIAEQYLLEEGDVLFARSGATVGKTYQFVNYQGQACFAGYLIKATADKNKILSKYLYLFTLSGAYESWKNSIFIKATIQNIGADKYNNLKISTPPIDEQKQIIKYLENETSRIDTIATKTKKEIELLQEYRTALISEVVTGKIDVRDWKAPEIAC